MAPPADLDDLEYVLLVLKHAEFKPDYRAIANEAVKASANNAYVATFSVLGQYSHTNRQKKFKKIVESAGFALVNGAVTGPNECGAAHVTPKKPRAEKAADTPANKKRKVKEAVDEETEDGEATEEKEN